ncbi:hypothetical protein Cylst_5502 [Cylindrospermum stagnale PCC 7417]|uniref:Uncharacterized protein n=1 Tax=Cylindrospermum stagnale PCC 7417 TaxID=56107 RepID=K9X4V5_9NOST|nr:hypothetical protein [Cylindrospermum stagnale]AFZ27513.1 hypothetical protein Cylst_5502 [Cylindrospermum stagnale PCC 7417]
MSVLDYSAKPMEPTTLALAIATIFLTKALEKSGENFSDGFTKKIGEVLAKIRKHSPETATALAAADPQVLNLDKTVLEQIPPDPIFAELVDTADAEKNATFQDKFQAVKTGGTINIIGKQITVTQAGTGNTQTNTFSNF